MRWNIYLVMFVSTKVQTFVGIFCKCLLKYQFTNETMSELISVAKEWFFSLGEMYGVNPIIFGSIYVGAIPFFTVSVGWLVRNYKKEKPIILPAISSVLFFVSSYLYLLIVGENVPWWVYLIIVLILTVAGYSTIKKIRARLKSPDVSKYET